MDVVDRVCSRRPVVDEGIGLERDEGLDVVSGGETDAVDATDLADVVPHLGGGVDADTHEVELRVGEDLGDHHLADEAGAPHDDALGHPFLFRSGGGYRRFTLPRLRGS